MRLYTENFGIGRPGPRHLRAGGATAHESVRGQGLLLGPEMRRDTGMRIRTCLAGLCLLLCAALPAAAQGLPGVPRGMVSVNNRIWIDRNTSAAERKEIVRRIAAAEAGIAKAFGKRRSAPLWQICATSACDKANGMSGRAMTYGPILITVTSKAVKDGKTYLHEHAHAEMASALPLRIGATSRLPNWFDEGLATIVSRSAGYPKNRAKECKAVAKQPLPKTRNDFVRLSKKGGSTRVYLRSACAVLEWLDAGRSPADARARLRAGKRLP